MPNNFRIPLFVVFAIQELLVIAAFVAVIVILTDQQRREFKNALHEQLTIQQVKSMADLTNPVWERKAVFDTLIKSYIERQAGFVMPRDDDAANSTSVYDRAVVFYDHVNGLARYDPFVLMIAACNESTYRDPSAPNTTTYSTWAVDNEKLTVLALDIASACLSGYPFSDVGCPMATFPMSSALAWGVPEGFRGVEIFGPPRTQEDPFNPERMYTSMSYTYTINFNPIEAFSINLKMPHVLDIMLAATATPKSRNAAFSQYYREETKSSDYWLISGKLDFPIVNPNSDSALSAGVWRGGETPDPILNEIFHRTKNFSPNTTGTIVMEMKLNGGDEFTVTATREAEVDHEFDWLMIQYTPRDEFYGASDRTRVTGIIIGCAGAVVVFASCALIWLAIHYSLRRLKSNMELAADMRNDRVDVDALNPAVTLLEISNLVAAFLSMNTKLLRARPFLPQSLLVGNDSSGMEEDEDEEGDFASANEKEKSDVFNLVKGTRHNLSSPELTADDRVSVVVDSEANEGTGDHSPVATNRQSNSDCTTRSDRRKIRGGKRVGPMSMSTMQQFETRRVGILSINTLGFSAATSSVPSIELHRILATLGKIIEVAAIEERGIVDYFHGDRFICGFNTARTCGNPSRNGAVAASKIWNRFCANPMLSAVFPRGLAMGLGSGTATVGNHGTDTMQRLGTIGAAFSEAVKLEAVMSRRVLTRTFTPIVQSPSQVPASDDERVPMSALVSGRCLMIGRTLQDSETFVATQIIGCTDAVHLMPSAANIDTAHDVDKSRNVSTYANTKNAHLRNLMGQKSETQPGNCTIAQSCPASRNVVLAVVGDVSDVTHNVRQPTSKPAPLNVTEEEEWLYALEHQGKRNGLRTLCNRAMTKRALTTSEISNDEIQAIIVASDSSGERRGPMWAEFVIRALQTSTAQDVFLF